MANNVNWGMAIPQVFYDGPVDMKLISQWAQKAEQLNFHSLWVQESIVGDSPVLEPVNLLSYIAAITHKVKLGTSVMVAPLRNPVQLAKSLGSLDHMSAGRLIVGLGLGGQNNDVEPFGISPERRVRRYVEIMEVMKALWTQTEAQYDGHFWKLEGTQMEPKPVQKPYPPLWLGARHPNALSRAVRHADGWMGAGSSTTASFVEGVGQTRMFLEEAGKDPATFTISKRVYIAVDDDEKRAEGRLREWFGKRYKNADMASQVAVWGSTAKCADKLGELAEAGAEMLLLNPAFDHMEQLELLAKDVVPQI
ncbi:MAG TPA: LLM class flavin-dependent oxidoreductase [Dehalococcoidia bacterium]|nr:LLM class flavin-dependent oxidoreductase [Dehalococcoidia bacterium]